MSNSLGNNAINFIAYHLTKFRDSYFKGYDILAYMGGIDDSSIDYWKNVIQTNGLTAKSRSISKLVILLSTNGGSASAVEKMVEISRYFYNEVEFVILDRAMSAGTIWVMSGDNIHMNYSSSLGPIDPQVPDPSGRYVPALGYLDKINEIIEKSQNGDVTQAELMLLQSNSLGMIRLFEQARDLSIALLKKWLVLYKFKDWNKHSDGQYVTQKEKEERALEIANQLSDNNLWHSHGRFIGINTLKNILKLKIEDFSENTTMCNDCDAIRNSMREFITMYSNPILIIHGYNHQGDEDD